MKLTGLGRVEARLHVCDFRLRSMHVYLEMDGLNFSDRLLLLRSVYPCGLHSCLCFFSLHMYAGLCMYVCMCMTRMCYVRAPVVGHVPLLRSCVLACARAGFMPIYIARGVGGGATWYSLLVRMDVAAKMSRIAQLREGVRRDCVEWRAQTLLCCMATGSLAFGKRPLQCPQIMKSYFIFIALLSL